MAESKAKIETPSGEGVLEKIWVSELGYLMVKVYYEDRKIWINHNLGIHDSKDNIFTSALKEKTEKRATDERPK
ncbi:MAG: hypothetical protein AABY15_02260 [Nanoarchaeota archaeon]